MRKQKITSELDRNSYLIKSKNWLFLLDETDELFRQLEPRKSYASIFQSVFHKEYSRYKTKHPQIWKIRLTTNQFFLLQRDRFKFLRRKSILISCCFTKGKLRKLLSDSNRENEITSIPECSFGELLGLFFQPSWAFTFDDYYGIWNRICGWNGDEEMDVFITDMPGMNGESLPFTKTHTPAKAGGFWL